MKPEMNYWTIRKYKGISKINWNKDNPVQSTYEILWQDVKYASEHPDEVSSNSLQNTMRRILEHYYKYYGDISLNRLPDKVNGNIVGLQKHYWHGQMMDHIVSSMISAAHRYSRIRSTFIWKHLEWSLKKWGIWLTII